MKEFSALEIAEKVLVLLDEYLEDDACVAEALTETYIKPVEDYGYVTKGQISDGQREVVIQALKTASDKDGDEVNMMAWAIIKGAVKNYLTLDAESALELLEYEHSL